MTENDEKTDMETVKEVAEQNGWSLDPRVREELDNTLSEEDLIGMYSGAGGNEERVPLIQQFAPDGDEWGGKSVFYPGQPRAITLADNLAEAFPVLLPSEEFISSFIEDYEMRLTSVEGVSRDQLMRIFMAMFGSSTPDDSEGAGSLELMLSAGPESNE